MSSSVERRSNPAAWAAFWFLHRNTLINRLERIQAVLGRSVVERPAETQAALVLAELFTRRRDDPTTGRDQYGLNDTSRRKLRNIELRMQGS